MIKIILVIGSMKKKILIILILAICCNKLYSQTELYKQYENRTEFTVMCIMQFPITDSVKTDITLFVPNSEEELWPMVEEFNLGLSKDTVLDRYKREKTYPLYGYNVCKDDIKKIYVKKSDEDYKNMSKLVYNFHTGTIIIFHNIDTKERNYEIEYFLIKGLKNPEILPRVK